MFEPKPLNGIDYDDAENSAHRDSWERQRRSAEEIVARFQAGLDTVLLADEVGMGKTYAALAVMADHLSKPRALDPKVLLIMPPSAILRDKWQNEIGAFNASYLAKSKHQRKNMHPIVIDDFWHLLRNLRGFDNIERSRVDEGERLPFTWCLFNWAYREGLLKLKKRVPWPCIAELNLHAPEVFNFLSHNSEHAIRGFLDHDYENKSRYYIALFQRLRSKDDCRAEIAEIYKRFVKDQKCFEPNIYIVGMNRLKPPRVDESESKLLCKYMLANLLAGRHEGTRKDVVASLVQADVLPNEFQDKHSHRWKYYLDSMRGMVQGDFYGLRAAVAEVIELQKKQSDWDSLVQRWRDGDTVGAQEFFKGLRDEVVATQLKRAGIGLAVIDEVHNWKGGKHGAAYFQEHYSQAIDSKLIMSATPFQMDEREMETVFRYVQKTEGGSAQAMAALYADSGPVQRCFEASNDFALQWQAVSAHAGHAKRIGDAFDNLKPHALAAAAAQMAGDYAEAGELRDFARALGQYRQAIGDLEGTLGRIVIRHTKDRARRHFHIGEDFQAQASNAGRNALYAANGYADTENAMVNFVGMRLGQLVLREEKKSYEANARLLGGLTSSKAAFLENRRKLGKTPDRQAYADMFERLLKTAPHPKVAATVQRAYGNYLAGRKTLIFCERLATLEEIREALQAKIHLPAQAPSKLKPPRELEYSWWHSLWEASGQPEQGEAFLSKHLPEAELFARDCLLAISAHPSVRRIVRLVDLYLLGKFAQSSIPVEPYRAYLKNCYLPLLNALQGEIATAACSYLTTYLEPRKKVAVAQTDDGEQQYDLGDELAEDNDVPGGPEQDGIDKATAAIRLVADSIYRESGSLWLADGLQGFHALLWKLLADEAGRQSTDATGLTAGMALRMQDIQGELMEGLRRLVLRGEWAVRADQPIDKEIARIVQGLQSRTGNRESRLERIVRFLADLSTAEGSFAQTSLVKSKRKSMWQGVTARRVDEVEVLNGSTKHDKRVGLCDAFNSPLAPHILICTSVGSEGIDMHRECADLIHHDLPWNPAKLEQRNGRVDRVGALVERHDGMRINFGIPFLAHDYEQYQYRKVYSRAQKFEILLGKPEFDSDANEEEDYSSDSEDATREAQIDQTGAPDTLLAPLPPAVLEALRLNLAVCSKNAGDELSAQEQSRTSLSTS